MSTEMLRVAVLMVLCAISLFSCQAHGEEPHHSELILPNKHTGLGIVSVKGMTRTNDYHASRNLNGIRMSGRLYLPKKGSSLRVIPVNNALIVEHCYRVAVATHRCYASRGLYLAKKRSCRRLEPVDKGWAFHDSRHVSRGGGDCERYQESCGNKECSHRLVW
jgi:hypothetical protein